jgi:heptosyltransferase-2
MKRECPLKHHECMKNIEVSDILEAISNLEHKIL